MSIDDLKALSRHRWMIPVLAQFAEQRGQRHAVILHALPIGRESLSRTLDAAVKACWIKRSARHGHPLRPEYLLTESGASTVTLCSAIMAAQSECGIEAGSLGRWALPILASIGPGEGRFNAIQRLLGDATPRAIIQAIKGLLDMGLLERQIVAAFPPVPIYQLTGQGRALVDGLGGGSSG